MKQFIEIKYKDGKRTLLNINYIEQVIEHGDGSCTIYIAFNCPNAIEQDFIDVNMTYD